MWNQLPSPTASYKCTVTAWAVFSVAPLSSATLDISKPPCHFNDTFYSAWPQDRHLFIVVPPSHE
ncbi:hypothetical protein V5799_024259, partial [Amblyomma americanum]